MDAQNEATVFSRARLSTEQRHDVVPNSFEACCYREDAVAPVVACCLA